MGGSNIICWSADALDAQAKPANDDGGPTNWSDAGLPRDVQVGRHCPSVQHGGASYFLTFFLCVSMLNFIAFPLAILCFIIIFPAYACKLYKLSNNND